MQSDPLPANKNEDEPPPFLGTWRRVYVWVLWYLMALIWLLYFVSRALTY